jgi:hypothetical protein
MLFAKKRLRAVLRLVELPAAGRRRFLFSPSRFFFFLLFTPHPLSFNVDSLIILKASAFREVYCCCITERDYFAQNALVNSIRENILDREEWLPHYRMERT